MPEEDQALPFQCSTLPPTTQTSCGPLPHTPPRRAVVPEATARQMVPSQCSTVPSSPTAQTSCGPLPHTPLRLFVVLEGMANQALPFHLRTVPPEPTAQTSCG